MRKRVLVVDDDPGTRELLAAVISEFGAEVFGAGTDDEAYQKFLELGPDLLFIDVLLPRQGGLDLLRRIRGVRGGKEVPAFVMSALYRGADLRAQSVGELGALDFLKKPFQMDTLRARLAQLLPDDGEVAADAVDRFAPAEVPSRGSLAAVDVPLLLRGLVTHKATGCLNLRSGRTKKVLFLREGEILFAVSNQLRETLGRSLLERGVIDDEVYRAGLEAMRGGGNKMGEFLVASGALEPKVLFDAVRQNVLDKVLDVFSWQDGDFRLSEYHEPPAPLPGQPLDGPRVVWQGVRERFPYDRLGAALAPHLGLALVPQNDLFQLATEVPLQKEDLQFLRLVHRLRGKTLGAVLSEVQGEHEVRCLYYLLLGGYLGLARADGGGVTGLDSADLERVRRARRRLELLRASNYFRALEVPLDASDERVREAYLHRAKDSHPDMLAPGDPAELRQLHAELFQTIQAAYDALKTASRRQEYLAFIRNGPEDEVTDGAKILEAETMFQEGRIHLKRRNWEAAAAAFLRAVELNPDEGEYALHLGIARMRQAAAGKPDALAEAEELFHRARTSMPSAPEAYYRLGRLSVLRDDLERATSYFQSALARSPNHVEALRELRLIKMRSEKKAGGVLGALLQKKEKS